ncbi:MAG: HU family DNA-binding protein [Holosporales bacterium]
MSSSGQTKTLTRMDILETFSRQFMLSQTKASFLLETILEEVFNSLMEKNSLKISSFGTFIVHQKKQRLGRNPKTGKDAVITARKSLSFRGSQILKDKISRRMARA